MFVCWGELLWDIFPSGRQLGGAAANVAINLQRLGAKPLLVSRVGADAPGDEALRQLAALGLDTSFIQQDPDAPTGAVCVELANGEPCYTIARQAAWQRLATRLHDLPDVAQIMAVVYGAMAQRSPLLGGSLCTLLRARSKTCWSICDLNVRPPFTDRACAETALLHADAVKMNEAELASLAHILGAQDPVPQIFSHFDVSVVAITRQARGCTLFDRDRRVDHPGFPKLGDAGDPVGAGDAFCAALAVCLTQGFDLEKTASLANDHARRVASAHGAFGFALM